MSLCFRRLHGAPRLFPRIIRRAVATEARATEATFLESQEDEPLRPAIASSTSAPKNTGLKVHEYLDKSYKIGGRLELGVDPLDRHNVQDVPKWGPWGVPLKLQEAGITNVTTA